MLTEFKIKNLKPRDKKYMFSCGRGLWLRVDPNGRKYFIFRFTENKKECQFSLGVYPVISLADVRIKRGELQNRRAKGEYLLGSRELKDNLFKEVANEWLDIKMSYKAASYLKAVTINLKTGRLKI
ncbi:MAG: DUF4102 domain-containing protein [Synergistaceae bacterium]|nr:DUF4102 domain-containing protein [Synergistaceae bacterium]